MKELDFLVTCATVGFLSAFVFVLDFVVWTGNRDPIHGVIGGFLGITIGLNIVRSWSSIRTLWTEAFA